MYISSMFFSTFLFDFLVCYLDGNVLCYSTCNTMRMLSFILNSCRVLKLQKLCLDQIYNCLLIMKRVACLNSTKCSHSHILSGHNYFC